MPAETDAPPLGIGLNLEITSKYLLLPNRTPLNSQLSLAPKDITCQPVGFGLKKSKKYRVTFGIEQPSTCVGLRRPKSEYVGYTANGFSWRAPFGPVL